MNTFGARAQLKVRGNSYTVYRLRELEIQKIANLRRLPFSIRILLENLLRREDGKSVTADDIKALASWDPKAKSEKEIAFTPSRVVLQDFTGVPAIVDLAAMREKITQLGGDPKKINPLEPVDLVIDHSVQVDAFGSAESFNLNVKKEYERNAERYRFLRWGQQAFQDFRVVPPGTGIVHQVNLEYLAGVVMTKKRGNETLLYPDSLVGTDSHTTMINGLGVLGWGVGGIEAEAAMLGQPVSMLIPEVVGFKLTGQLPEGATATDLVLTATQMLRKKGVVGKFVEFYGPGLEALTLADRATIANMAPEYGATMGYFPVDAETINYLRLTGRDEALITLVETYLKEQNLFWTSKTEDPEFSAWLELDLKDVTACLAGPKRPQDRIILKEAKKEFRKSLVNMLEGKTKHLDSKRVQGWLDEGGSKEVDVEVLAHSGLGALAETADVQSNGNQFKIGNGSIVIAAITSCTNTSNPAVMIGAGLLARNAVNKGLGVKPWVKTSLAPGSQVVIDYLKATGLLPFLEKLSFNLVGFGCTTCIGNSGPLPEAIGAAVKNHDLVAVAVLSGNRNFEGRINPLVRANYLASPPLVVAYALAGSMDVDLMSEPLGTTKQGEEIYLRDIWPSQEEIKKEMKKINGEMFRSRYANVFDGDKEWQTIKIPSGATFKWEADSTYVKNPPFFENMKKEPEPVADIKNARVLVMLGDSVTTDHISPAGAIPKDGPAGKYLIGKGIDPNNFNSFGSRRGNHEVMMRGTFGNIRLRNLIAPGTEGGVTRHLPEGKQMPIFEASEKYRQEGVETIILAGKEYGSGSSRDWAAKGPALLGVRAVIAESYERIHRSNLIGMGILPLQFENGQNAKSIRLTGEEIFTIEGIAGNLKPGKKLTCAVKGNTETTFTVLCRIDTPVELAYYQHGGILRYVLRELLKS